ncbi:MAG TPA: hypothetical protein VFF73_19580 [Planctomycetota bacterium]|nr:hypothetical protein [Planctomycetota bacterium]
MRPLAKALVVPLLLAGVASAQEAGHAPPDVAAAIADVDSALALWTKAAPATLELSRTAAKTMQGLADDVATGTLHQSAAPLRELRTKLAARRNELLFGATAPAPDETPPDRERTLETYDVRSIVEIPPDMSAAAPRLGFHPTERFAGAGSFVIDDSPNPSRGIDADKLRDIADRSNTDGGSYELSNGRLLVRGTATAHERVRTLLAACRTFAERRVAFDLASYRMTPALGRELEALSGPDGSLGEAGERRLDEALARGEATLAGLETRSVHDGETFTTWTGEVRRLQEDAAIGSCVATGQRVHVRPMVEAAARRVLLDVAFETVQPAGAATDLDFVRAATRIRAPLGRTTLVGGTFAVGSGTTCVLAVKPLIVGSALDARIDDAHSERETALPERPLGTLAPAVETEVGLLETLIARADRLRELVGTGYQLAFFDVRDLAFDGLARNSPRLGVANADREWTWRMPRVASIGGEWAPAFADPDGLEALIKSSTGAEETWGDPASYELHRGSIIVHQTPAVLARIEGALAKLRADLDRQARVEADLYEVEPAFVRELLARATAPSVLDGKALAWLDGETKRARLAGAGLVVAPIGGATVYVAEGHERLSTDALERTGWVLELRAQADGNATAITAGLTRAERERDLHVVALNATARLEPGSAAFSVAVTPGSAKASLLVLRLRSVTPSRGQRAK